MNFNSIFSNNDWKKLKEFEKLDLSEKQIVFYAESKASFNHFRLLIKEILENYEYSICVVTSIKEENFFKDKRVRVFNIGVGTARTKFFITLKTKILIMDLPDLNKFHIKKSKIYPVHYVYLFHSMFSVHSYLRENAVDEFDTIFCVGKHHLKEISETEKIYRLKNKNLIEYGFGRLDELYELKKQVVVNEMNSILIVPSYGKNNLLENCGKQLIKILLENGLDVILRPHYKTIKESKKIIEDIKLEFKNYNNFRIHTEVIPNELFFNSKAMITDWSGISFEYAFITHKPVFFIDVPQKILNPNYKNLGLEPIEIILREKIGFKINPKNLNYIIDLLNDKSKHKKIEEIDECREQLVFNFTNSSKIGAIEIDKIIKNN